MTRWAPTTGLAAALSLGLAHAAFAAPDCRCRHAGTYYHTGEYACIRTPSGPRLALCGRVANLSSWKFTDRVCDRVAAVDGRRSPAPQAKVAPRR